MSMHLDTDFIRFSREMKPTKQCKISQKNLRSDQGGGLSHHRPPPPLNTPLPGPMDVPPVSNILATLLAQSIMFTGPPFLHLLPICKYRYDILTNRHKCSMKQWVEMCRIDFLISVQNRYFGSFFWKKKLGFGSEWVWFSSVTSHVIAE